MISSTRRAVVLLLATFVLGGAVGAAAMAYGSRTSPPPQGRAAGYLDRLTRELHLSPVQQDSVKAVLDRYTPAMDSLMSEIRPRLDTVRAAMRTEITSFLDPQQQKEYQVMQQKRDQERKAGASNVR